MSLRLTSDQLRIVRDVLEEEALGKKFFVFGSRAGRSPKPHSDLDLYCNERLQPMEFARLRMSFDESDLPFRVDVLDQDMALDIKDMVQITGAEEQE